VIISYLRFLTKNYDNLVYSLIFIYSKYILVYLSCILTVAYQTVGSEPDHSLAFVNNFCDFQSHDLKYFDFYNTSFPDIAQ